MTTPDYVLLSETKGAVRLLTLNRPAKLNAINADLVHALTDALHAVQADDDISVVILRGAGRAFSAGADTSTPRPLTEENRSNLIRHGDANIALTKLLGRIDKPIIAAVHGYALGAGAGLAFGSDLVVAAESARFGYPELKAGLTATTVTAQAVHLMGRKVAFELLTLCDNMLPGRAYNLGSSIGSYLTTNCWKRRRPWRSAWRAGTSCNCGRPNGSSSARCRWTWTRRWSWRVTCR